MVGRPNDDAEAAGPILQVLISPCSSFLLVRSEWVAKLMSINGEPIAEERVAPVTSWMNHPCDGSLILSI